VCECTFALHAPPPPSGGPHAGAASMAGVSLRNCGKINLQPLTPRPRPSPQFAFEPAHSFQFIKLAPLVHQPASPGRPPAPNARRRTMSGTGVNTYDTKSLTRFSGRAEPVNCKGASGPFGQIKCNYLSPASSEPSRSTTDLSASREARDIRVHGWLKVSLRAKRNDVIALYLCRYHKSIQRAVKSDDGSKHSGITAK